ncbi:MAG: hypothetical protein LH478_12095, partial [Chitinophagaceae bacterium]|nr:hypothetical protein [Chitinophagaceae bacterium]
DTVAKAAPIITPVKKDTVAKVAPIIPPVKKDIVAKAAPIIPPVKKDTVAKAAPIIPPVKKDSAVTTNVKPPVKDTLSKTSPAVIVAPALKDTVAKVAPTLIVKNFVFKPADPHFVIVVMDKVDPVYASEAKNAFNRYNREKFYNKPIEMGSLKLDDRYNIVLQGPFSDANAAVDYIDKVRPVTNSRILPWLNADKYSFLVISAENLELLKTSLDMTAYKQLIQQAFPGKF